MKQWATSIFAATLVVEDLAAAKAFYLNAFALPVVFEDANSAVFKIGETMINLLAASAAPELFAPEHVAPRTAGSRVVFSISVPDVDALCAELTGRGVHLISGPMDRPWGIRTASFQDPAGHIWEIAK